MTDRYMASSVENVVNKRNGQKWQTSHKEIHIALAIVSKANYVNMKYVIVVFFSTKFNFERFFWKIKLLLSLHLWSIKRRCRIKHRCKRVYMIWQSCTFPQKTRICYSKCCTGRKKGRSIGFLSIKFAVKNVLLYLSLWQKKWCCNWPFCAIFITLKVLFYNFRLRQ